MLNDIYMQVLDMTKIAGVVILVVILARLLLKKAPKVFSYLLWAVVLFRLLCPVGLEAPISILPQVTPVSQTYSLADESISIVGAGEAAYQAVGDVLNGGMGIQHIKTTEKDAEGMVKYVTTDWWEVWILFGKYVWLAGIAGMMLYSVSSYLKLKKSLAVVVPFKNNIFIADDIKSPFVIGLWKPKIYLPCGLSEKEQEYIILHEQHHIRRLDHIIKVLAFLALSLHWFNPLVWIAFALANKDMEMSCDEAVIRKMGEEVRADYSASLLTLATGHRIIAGTPLAFGEGDTKGRIRNLANWKKPAFLVSLVAVIGCVVLIMCLLTDPTSQNRMLLGAEYAVAEKLYGTSGEDETVSDEAQYCITADYCLYESDAEGNWAYIGAFEPYTFSKEELEKYTVYDEGWKRRYRVGTIADSYILRLPDADDHFYIVFQTGRGDTLLGYGWEDLSERGQGASDDTGLKWLYRLESKFDQVGKTGSFLDRSLAFGVGSDVDIYYTWTNAKLPGYVIVGFMAGDGDFNEKTDMGFAVFYHNSDESGYRLLDYHVYENAALADRGIYVCEHPAVADINGDMKENCTFDVILINNDDVAKVTRVYEYANGKTQTVSEPFVNAHNVALFSWDYEDTGCTVWQYFYDENGNMIDYSGEIKTEDVVNLELQRAKKEGCVVMEDGDVTHGQRIWQDFVKATEEGKSASVRMAHYYTLDPETCSEQYYEEHKDNYPMLEIFELAFDGSSYTLCWNEDGMEYISNYQYLIHFVGDAPSPNATYDSYDRYVLLNDNTVTWEEIWQRMLSSYSVEHIEHYSIYTDLQ